MSEPLVTNDAVILGILMCILAFVFWTSSSDVPFWKRFYSIVPSLLLCYFLPSLLSTFGIVSSEQSQLYFVASRYLLPASLVLLTLSIDYPGIIALGPKAIVMFLTGTVGVIIGGPLAILIVSIFDPSIVGGQGPDAIWRGLTTIAGSWIGGGANQTAMKEVFEVGDEIFSAMIAVDVLVANVWMAVLLFLAGRSKQVDGITGADDSAIDELKTKVEAFQARIARIPTLAETMIILAIGFGATGFSHLVADFIAPFIAENYKFLEQYSLTSTFFWIVVVATTIGMLLALTRARNLEGAGASRMGSVFLYVLVATIGMNMDIMAIFSNPGLFLVGAIWILIHVILMLGIGWLIKAPIFFVAVGSQANIGGAASAPIVASAFHPALAPVGVLLAVLGYALGTYGAYICGLLMQSVAPQ